MPDINWLLTRSSPLDQTTVKSETVDAIVQCQAIQVKKANATCKTTRIQKKTAAISQSEDPFMTDTYFIEALTVNELSVPQDLEKPICSLSQITSSISIEDWIKFQDDDEDIREIKSILSNSVPVPG